MMRRVKFFWLLALLLVPVMASAQMQQGYVKTKGRLASNGTRIAGTRLSGAMVSVRGGNAVTSGSNGTFSLSLSNSSYYLQNVQKQGYVLTDPDVLSKQYAYSKNPLVLVLETPGQQTDDRLAAERKIRRKLEDLLRQKEDEIDAQREQNKLTEEQYRRLLQELNDQQESNTNLINEMAERYSKIDFDDLDEFNLRISNLILDGKLAEADSLLNTKGDIHNRGAQLRLHQEANAQAEEELKKSQKKLEKSKAQAQRELEDLAQDCYTKSEIFKMQHLTDSAVHYLEFRSNLNPDNINWLYDLGQYVQVYVADNRRALAVYEKALQKVVSRDGDKSLDVAVIYNNMAKVYEDLGKYAEAVDYDMKALEIEEEIFGECHPSISTSNNNLGHVYTTMGKYEEALACHEKSFSCIQGSPSDSVRYLINIAGVYLYKGEYKTAEHYYTEALGIAAHIEENSERHFAACYSGLASLLGKAGRHQDAIDYSEKALDLRKKIFGDNHPEVALSYNNIGSTYSEMGRYKEAQEYLLAALKIEQECYGDWHPQTAYTHTNIGFAYSQLGDYEKAMEHYNMALETDKAYYGKNHQRVGTDLINIGAVYMNKKDYSHALDYYFEALDVYKSVVGEKNPYVGNCYNNIGHVYNETGEYEKAIEYLKKSLEIDLAVYGPDNKHTATTYNNLGNSYNMLGDYATAAMYVEKVLPILLKAYGENHPNVAMTYYNIGVLHKKQGRYKKALELSEKALGILSKIVPEGHPVLKTINDGINDVKSKMKK